MTKKKYGLSFSLSRLVGLQSLKNKFARKLFQQLNLVLKEKLEHLLLICL